jgi:hypothetical protein
MATNLNNLAVDLHYTGDFARAEAFYRQSLQLWREIGDAQSMLKPLHNLGLIALSRDDVARAAVIFREVLALERANNDKGGICSTLYNLGLCLSDTRSIHHNQHGWHEAESCFTESLSLARQLNNRNMIALSFVKLGELTLERGDESSIIEAITLFEDGLDLQKELGDRAALAYTLNNLGFATLLHGDRAKARSLLEEGLALSQALSDMGKISMNLRALAIAKAVSAFASGSREEAESVARRTVQLFAAAIALKDTILLQIKRRYYQSTMDKLRAILPHHEIDALEEAGRAMSVDEAIALALAPSLSSHPSSSVP